VLNEGGGPARPHPKRGIVSNVLKIGKMGKEVNARAGRRKKSRANLTALGKKRKRNVCKGEGLTQGQGVAGKKKTEGEKKRPWVVHTRSRGPWLSGGGKGKGKKKTNVRSG